jgi:hypothetical protein
MDLVQDPFACGMEDDATGVFTGAAGSDARRIVIVYVPVPASLRVFVIDISFI